MSWYLAPSLAQLRKEVNARWPERSKASDGAIGDPSHAARRSDHNPNARRSVNAIDVTARGIDPDALVRAAVADPRCNYVIYNRRIWSRVRNFRPVKYTGSNPHTSHVHISILQTRAAEQDSSSWGLAKVKPPAPAPKPSKAPAFPLKRGQYFGPEGRGNNSVSGYHSHRSDLKRYQSQMKARGWRRMLADGLYGRRGQTKPAESITGDLTLQFQREKGLAADGLVGPVTWRAAWEAK